MDHTWLEEETKTWVALAFSNQQTSQIIQRHLQETLLLSTNQNQAKRKRESKRMRRNEEWEANI